MMTALLAAFVLAAAPATSSAPVGRVAIIVLGSDARAAGSLQRTLEQRVAPLNDVEEVPSWEIATHLTGGLSAPPIDLAGPKREAELLDQATAAFYDAQLDAALAKITMLESSQDRRNGVSIGERKRAHLWHAVFLLTKGDRLGADAQVRRALVLDPDLQADLRVFPPALREVVDSARAQGFRKIAVTIEGLPPGAEIRVDERPEQTRFSVPAGKHWITTAARGFRSLETSFESNEDLTLTLPLALSFAESASLAEWIAADDAAPLPSAVLAAADAGALDLLFVVAEKSGRRRVREWKRLGRGARSAIEIVNPAGTEKLVSWVAKEAGIGAAAAVDARIAGIRAAWKFEAAGGLAIASTERRTKGGASFESAFSGAGPRLAVAVSHRFLRAELAATALSFDGSTEQVTLPDGSSSVIGGGTRASVSIAAGWEHVFGPGEAEYWPALRVLAGVQHEEHHARAFRDARGDLGLYPSWTHDSALVRASFGMPVASLARGPLRTEAQLSLRPLGTWRESPSGATGQSPRVAPSAGISLGLSWQPRGKWRVAADASWDQRRVTFTGDGFAPLAPVLRNAQVTETVTGGALELSRLF